MVPTFGNHTIGEQLSLNDSGNFDPLDSDKSIFKIWIDDLIIGYKHSDTEHMTILSTFINHIARLGLKINIIKSRFLINIKTGTFNILGFTIS